MREWLAGLDSSRLPSFNCPTPALADDMIYFAGWSPGKSDSPWPSWQTILDQFDKNKDGKISAEEYGSEKAWFGPRTSITMDSSRGRLGENSG